MTPSRRPAAVALACILATLLAGVADSQMAPTSGVAGAPGPSAATEDCLTVLSNAADCLSYVEAGSNLTAPEKPCCAEMKQVINNRPDCLCQMLAKNNTIGIDFDVHKALKLPTICHVSTPPVSMCALIGVPVGVPTGAPGVAPSSGSSDASTPGASAPGTTSGATRSRMEPLIGAALLLQLVLTF